EQMERLHFKVEELESLSRLPEDMSVLVILRPGESLDADAFASLQEWVLGGGALLVGLDPEEKTNIGDFLQNYGVKVNADFVFGDQSVAGQSRLLVPTYRGKFAHPATQSLVDGENPYLYISSTLAKIESDEAQYKVSSLLEHLPNSVGKKDIDPDSEVVSRGLQYAALISEGQGDSPFRLAVVGDSDFVTNQFYSRAANFDFSMGVLSYLSKDINLINFKPRVAETTYLLLTQTQLNLYFLFFIIPVVIVFFSVALFLRLKRFF
ncbi:MAG: Gldg family protein, partial [Pseudomonadota bacterium]